MELIQYPQQNGDAEIARKIIALENTAWPDDAEDAVFPSAPDTYFTSFLWMEGGRVVCHAGIRKSILHHKGERYLVYGLSEVVTHPEYQKRGLASRAIQKAAEFMRTQAPDLSIFTCAREKVGFYARRGWEAVPGACLIGGTQDRPFRSDSLNLVTMMAFFFPKAKQHREDFECADIVLELGENQLW